MESWQPYVVTTRNTSATSENKIHDDREAQRYGFKGGLVPGTVVYAHMTRPVVARFGEAWLARNSGELALLKPAYEGERLEVRADGQPGGDSRTVHIRVGSPSQAELATLDTCIPAALPVPDPLSGMAPDRSGGERVPIGWDAVVPGRPLRPWAWQTDVAQQEEWCSGISDDLAIYRGASAPVHPGLMVQAANRVFGNHFLLKPWIHVGSKIVTRALLRVGQAVEVRAVPVERWEKKGHQFLKLYVVLVTGGEAVAEIWHSAIFSVRPAV